MNHTRVLLLALSLLSLHACKTDIDKVREIMQRDNMPDMSGENMQMWYTDSARLKYHVITPRYDRYNREERQYEEFPLGLHVSSLDTTGNVEGTLDARHARRLENQNIWEMRDSVVVTNAEGKRLETDLLYWDMDREWIYTSHHVRLVSGDQLIEGDDGFESDQNLNYPVFKKVTGELELEDQP
jgi:LPS export ABC transporter protein LptC